MQFTYPANATIAPAIAVSAAPAPPSLPLLTELIRARRRARLRYARLLTTPDYTRPTEERDAELAAVREEAAGLTTRIARAIDALEEEL